MRADGFLLGELQFAQGAIANVVVRNISARMVQKWADAVLGHAGRLGPRWRKRGATYHLLTRDVGAPGAPADESDDLDRSSR